MRNPTTKGSTISYCAQCLQSHGVQIPKHLTTSGIKSDPTFPTATKCFSSLATSPAAAASSAQEAEEDMKVAEHMKRAVPQDGLVKVHYIQCLPEHHDAEFSLGCESSPTDGYQSC